MKLIILAAILAAFSTLASCQFGKPQVRVAPPYVTVTVPIEDKN